MSKQSRWLAAESERWVGEQIINVEQAARIRALYPETPAPVAWGLAVFFGIGSIVIGLGVILLFAYNWDEIPKVGKLALIFASIIAAHGIGLRLRAQPDWRAWLGEGLALLGTMLFGAGIWLVAQVYHIDEHFPNGFLFWGLGALAMAWALPSIGQAILATVTLTLWACIEVMEFSAPTDVASLVLLAGVGGLVWRLRSALLAAFGVAGLFLTLLFNAGERGGETAVILAAVAFSTLLVVSGRLAGGSPSTHRIGAVLRFYGLLGALLCAYVLSFHDAADELLDSADYRRNHAFGLALYGWGLSGLALAAWAWAVVRVRRGERALVALEDWLFPAGLLFLHVMVVTGQTKQEYLVAAVNNLVVLFVGAMWAVRGCQEGRLRPVVLGSLLMAALVLARYFDLFESLAVRGLVFMAFGGALFAEGFYYRKMRLADAAERTTR